MDIIEQIGIDELRYRFNYCAWTGLFTWKNPKSRQCKPGQLAGRRMCCKTKNTDYRQLRAGGKNLLAHRVAWAMFYDEIPPAIIDHIDFNGLNNSIRNLRDGTGGVNHLHRSSARSDSTNGHLGLTLQKNGNWTVRLQIDGKQNNLGTFECLTTAKYIQKRARKMLLMGKDPRC